MDRREIKTKASIYAAFNTLLLKKSFSQITIQNIIDEANIGRSTFYSHFETKEDLLDSVCKDFYEHIMEEHKGKEKTHDFSHSINDLQNFACHILYHIRDSSFSIGGLIQGDTSNYFYDGLQKAFHSWCLTNLKPTKKIPEELSLAFISGNLVTICKWWVKNEYKETPERASLYYLDSIKDCL
jgi:AcrR family transcriptional regulator